MIEREFSLVTPTFVLSKTKVLSTNAGVANENSLSIKKTRKATRTRVASLRLGFTNPKIMC